MIMSCDAALIFCQVSGALRGDKPQLMYGKTLYPCASMYRAEWFEKHPGERGSFPRSMPRMPASVAGT
jgi:hypothetical protein